MWSLFVALLIFFMPQEAVAGNLTTILISDGTAQYPCDGVVRWTPAVTINNTVAKAYLFVNMSPNPGSGLDAVMWTPDRSASPIHAALADVHLLRVSPSTGYQGENERTFSPDRVFVTTTSVGVSCGGGNGFAEVYGEVWVDTP